MVTVAQVVEQWIVVPPVASSSLVSSAWPRFELGFYFVNIRRKRKSSSGRFRDFFMCTLQFYLFFLIKFGHFSPILSKSLLQKPPVFGKVLESFWFFSSGDFMFFPGFRFCFSFHADAVIPANIAVRQSVRLLHGGPVLATAFLMFTLTGFSHVLSLWFPSPSTLYHT